MQAKVILSFLLSALSVRWYVAYLVTNDEGIERRGAKVRVYYKDATVSQCTSKSS